MFPSQMNSPDVVQLLVENGAKINVQDTGSGTALIFAAQNENENSTGSVFRDNGSGTNSKFFLLNFFCIRFKTHNDVFFLLQKLYFYNFGGFVCEFITIFFGYPDPDQRFLKWIRIRNTEYRPSRSSCEARCPGQH